VLCCDVILSQLILSPPSAVFYLCLLLDREDRGGMLLRNVLLPPNYTELRPRNRAFKFLCIFSWFDARQIGAVLSLFYRGSVWREISFFVQLPPPRALALFLPSIFSFSIMVLGDNFFSSSKMAFRFLLSIFFQCHQSLRKSCCIFSI
jgi:hypothetical protein